MAKKSVLSDNKAAFAALRVLVATVVTYVIVTFGVFPPDSPLNGFPYWEITEGCKRAILALLMAYVIGSKWERIGLRAMGLKASLPGFGFGVLLGGGLVTLIRLVQFAFGLVEFDHFIWDLETELVAIPFVNLAFQAGVAFSEEILWRGYLLECLRHKMGPMVSVVVSSMCFAGLHFLFNSGHPLVFLNLTLLGMLCALVRLRYDSLWAAVGLHLAWNMVQGYGLQVNLSGNPEGLIIFAANERWPWFLTGTAIYDMEATVFAAVLMIGSMFVLWRSSWNRSASPTIKV